jgi:hypothetical protein
MLRRKLWLGSDALALGNGVIRNAHYADQRMKRRFP